MSRAWQLDNVEEELDDEEIARILQEEEYEIARQQQREAQQRQQQQAKQPAATQRPTTQAALLRYGSGPVAPTSTDELLLLQSRCSAVSGTTVLKGSCYLYRNMFKFVCVERGKEVDVPIPVSTIELINPAFSLPSKDSLAVPRVVPTPRGAQQNVLQIYTQDKRIHTFFNFADDKTFQQFFNILTSIHKNKTAPAPLPTMIPVPVAAATSPSPPATAAVSSQLAPSSTFAAAPVGTPAMMAPPGYTMYPGMYPQAYPGAFPPQPYFMMPPPHGYPVQLASPPTAQPPQTADASVSDFHQLHQQMMRLQIQQQQPMQQEASGQSPQPQPFMGAPYYYPYPPAAAAPSSATDAPSTPGDQQQSSALAGVAPPPYYYPPPMPYAMPTGAEFQPYGTAPYPYPYAVAPPAQVPQQPQPPTQQQQQQQSQPPRPSGPPEDLLA